MNQIVTRVHGESTDQFRRMGFNLRSARVLIVLLQHPGIYIGQLAEITAIDDSTLSHIISRLSRRRFVERRRSEDDTRYVSVHLTAEGARIARDCKKASDQRERKMLRSLSDDDVATLRTLLVQVSETVREESWHAEPPAAKKRAGPTADAW